MTKRTDDARRRRRPRQVTAKSLENAALAYLGRFASSRENLRRVLMRKVERAARAHGGDAAAGAALIAALVERLGAAGLLDDRTYAEARVRALRRRGASARLIRLRLAEKGVAGDLVEAALAESAQETREPELEAALRLAERRRIGPYRPEDERRGMRERDLGALARAGFSFSVALAVVDADSADALARDLSG